MITRFAPSPTGLLHLGNMRTAIISFLCARSSGGKFILRIDDTDKTRVREEYIEKIFIDLKWLGIESDLCFRQSERFSLYDEAMEQLIQTGRVYACYETPEELEMERRSLLSRGLPPVYRRRKEIKNSERSPYYRFELDSSDIISWDDKLRGKIAIDLRSTSDPIIRRENGIYTYMFPSVIDDIDYGIDTIIRGEDHISNTAVQIQMLKALGCNRIPDFAHMPLLKMQSGKISKRVGGYEIESLRNAHIEPEVICAYLLNLGGRSSADFKNFKEYKEFNLNHYSSSSSVIVSLEEIYNLNAKFLHSIAYEGIVSRLEKAITREFWEVIKKNLFFLSEVSTWWNICTDPNLIFEKKPYSTDIIRDAIMLLPEGEISPETYKQWLALLFERHKYTKKEININLRIALTGKESGPEIGGILPFIGRERILLRLKTQIDDV
ncbi:glutamate--tRNA ligase [Neorickettsia helminthoeca str. Oregon]|uniref:Glutamate--tRNA ligase n=1 Tax=Neorickettsia helminthoeca str. Oregon TaxID=1286528 RepID=X5HK42_9RICK|nr:glutamate--tRNA ligase [Neorickettsia helminthoeca]AHX11434.1 glutamate--tRNA ligase [Neorickettsia helminthoeca str. Oregon]